MKKPESVNSYSLMDKEILFSEESFSSEVFPFAELLSEYGFARDEQGIYQANQEGGRYIANFTNMEYLYNKILGNKKYRYVKIDDTIFEIPPHYLVNRSNFRRMLLSANYNLTCSQRQFSKLVNIILKLDNDKIITDTTGFGRVADQIYNFGNKILVNNELSDFKPVIWLGKKGYSLNKTDMLKVSEQRFDPQQVWDILHKLYGMQAVLIIGFAVASLFFQEYMEKEKKFPLLYIKAGSGRGKTGLTELIENLYGIKHPFSSINCGGNSTKIGIESKSVLLNNLPIIFNELTEKEFEFIKSRYDGQGSVKYSDYKPGNITERSVNGPTIITTVVEPRDKQVISRCVFINLDITEMQKTVFKQARKLAKDFSAFTYTVLKNISLKDIMTKIDEFQAKLDDSEVQPRISDNYSLIAGCFLEFCSLIGGNSDLPDLESIKNHITSEMKQTESFLNPLIYFLWELERLAECKISQKYITQDEDYLYFNFNGVWSLISQVYKDKYLPFITPSNIKRLLKKSRYIARYGRDFEANANNPIGKPVYNLPKLIKGTTRKCYVLLIEEMPYYYK